jgi:nucleoid-associated protein YgaU
VEVAPPEQTPPPAAREPFLVDAGSAGGRTYVIHPGDTLAELARRYYGDRSQWQRIQAAHAPMIDDPRRLTVGTSIVIP